MLLKSRSFVGVRLYRHLRQWYSERKPMEAVFSTIYHRNEWDDSESVSGPGSTLTQTAVVRAKLPGLLAELKANSLLDAPCGDFNWMQETKLHIDQYIGADIVPDLIASNQQKFGSTTRRFVKLDITKDQLPTVDVVLCRDCLFHLSYKAIFAALKNFKASHSQYLLTTTYPHLEENINIPIGGWRPLNLQAAPFNLPEPLELIDEQWIDKTGQNSGKHLGLWKLENISLKEAD